MKYTYTRKQIAGKLQDFYLTHSYTKLDDEALKQLGEITSSLTTKPTTFKKLKKKLLKNPKVKEEYEKLDRCPYCLGTRIEGICPECDKDFTEKYHIELTPDPKECECNCDCHYTDKNDFLCGRTIKNGKCEYCWDYCNSKSHREFQTTPELPKIELMDKKQAVLETLEDLTFRINKLHEAYLLSNEIKRV